MDENAIEKFRITMDQKKMKLDKLVIEAFVVESMGIDRFSRFGNTYYFKLK